MIKSFEVWCLFSNNEFEGETSPWVYAAFESWDELFPWDECLELRVMSTWVWVIITMHCFKSFRGIVDIALRVSLDGICKDSYIKSIDVH